jgi:hypothetical protein
MIICRLTMGSLFGKNIFATKIAGTNISMAMQP